MWTQKVIPRRIGLDRVHCIYIKEYAVVDTTVCFIVGVLPDNVFKQDPLSNYDSASSPDSVIKHEPLSPSMSTSSENSEVCVLQYRKGHTVIDHSERHNF